MNDIRRDSETMSDWNESANELLDAHHAVVGESGFGDDQVDTCQVCAFAVRDAHHHDTQAPIKMVQQWIVRWNVNHVQEAPSTSLTGTALDCYRQAARTIEAWDPFNGVSVADLERDASGWTVAPVR